MGNCILNEGNECIHCGECNRCDLNPDKICDNCCACLEKIDTEEQPFARIRVADIVVEQPDEYLQSFFADMEEEEGEVLCERPSPALMAEWEERLKEAP